MMLWVIKNLRTRTPILRSKTCVLKPLETFSHFISPVIHPFSHPFKCPFRFHLIDPSVIQLIVHLVNPSVILLLHFHASMHTRMHPHVFP